MVKTAAEWTNEFHFAVVFLCGFFVLLWKNMDVEVVFSNNPSALKCPQMAVFHRFLAKG